MLRLTGSELPMHICCCLKSKFETQISSLLTAGPPIRTICAWRGH